MPLSDILAPGLDVVIAGTIGAWHRAEHEHYYAGAGNSFWLLLHESGLTPTLLSPVEDTLLPRFGIGLTDLVCIERAARGEPPVWDLTGFRRRLTRSRPRAVAFLSKTAATSYARAAGLRLPRTYGPLSWPVAGRPGFVLPGPSGANNGMHLPVRIAMWRDLVDFLETV